MAPQRALVPVDDAAVVVRRLFALDASVWAAVVALELTNGPSGSHGEDLTGANALGRLLFLMTGLALMTWLWRVAWDTAQLDPDRGHLGAGWAVGGWFLPVANLVIPCLLVVDSWETTRDRADPMHRWVPAVTLGWWASFLAAMTVSIWPVGNDRTNTVVVAGCLGVSAVLGWFTVGWTTDRLQVALEVAGMPMPEGPAAPRPPEPWPARLARVGAVLVAAVGAALAYFSPLFWVAATWTESGQEPDVDAVPFVLAMGIGVGLVLVGVALMLHLAAQRARRPW